MTSSSDFYVWHSFRVKIKLHGPQWKIDSDIFVGLGPTSLEPSEIKNIKTELLRGDLAYMCRPRLHWLHGLFNKGLKQLEIPELQAESSTLFGKW